MLEQKPISITSSLSYKLPPSTAATENFRVELVRERPAAGSVARESKIGGGDGVSS